MRSSKSRSRSKSNRPRTVGNVVNRVFDSSGPEGKVRGTPQQIIEKYLILARDAQLSNDRVAAENFLQHAEHYTRLLGEAQRELAAEQEARQQHFQQNGNQFRDRGDRQDFRPSDTREDRYPGAGDQPEIAEPLTFAAVDEESSLVDTPEMKPARPEQSRSDQSRTEAEGRGENRPRNERRDFRRDRNERRPPRPDQAEAPRTEAERPAPAPAPEAAPAPVAAQPAAAPQAQPEHAAEAQAAAPKPRKPSAPRKPRSEKPAETGAADGAEKPAAKPRRTPKAADTAPGSSAADKAEAAE